MSRLDNFIRRMTAQRDILNHIGRSLSLPEGDIFELGLGNGRTYSHMRHLFPERRILAFDRQMGAHKTEAPEPEDVVLGEIRETAPERAGAGAALVHADIGTGYRDKDAIIAEWLPPIIVALAAKDAYVVSGLPLAHSGLQAMPQLPSVPLNAYFFYRRR